MTLAASIFAPAVASIAIALEPPQAPWPVTVDLDGPPVPAAAQQSFAATARLDGLPFLPRAGDLRAGGAPRSAPGHAESKLDEVALSDVLRWLMSFAGLAAIGALRNPRR